MCEMILLNMGCGQKACDAPGVYNIDFSLYHRVKKKKYLSCIAPMVLKGDRLRRFNSTPENIMIHDLKKGIPFESSSVDAAYHSHLLEHFDRHIGERFLAEVKRILKPGGVHRVVVPDFEIKCLRYIKHVAACLSNPDEAIKHDLFIARLLEQSVRRQASIASQQNWLKRAMESLFLGGARRRGQTHQWMYDRINLKQKLLNAGFREVKVVDYKTSSIPDWSMYGLDVNDRGEQYRPGSLYMEAIR